MLKIYIFCFVLFSSFLQIKWSYLFSLPFFLKKKKCTVTNGLGSYPHSFAILLSNSYRGYFSISFVLKALSREAISMQETNTTTEENCWGKIEVSFIQSWQHTGKVQGNKKQIEQSATNFQTFRQFLRSKNETSILSYDNDCSGLMEW